MTAPALPAPLVSVVIPTYQRAPLLERCLESLTEQTLPADQFEVVVVDDGSSDWTALVCSRFAAGLRLRRFWIVNSGISAAKNLGLYSSEAPLVLFFDDDDLAGPGLLEAHLEAHQAHPQENIAVLGYTTWAPELEVTPVMEYVTDIGKLLFAYPQIEDGALLDHTYFWGGRSSCKRSFLARHGVFDPDLGGIEDIELGFRLSKRGLGVVHARAARSYMLRSVTFDEFAQRCLSRGRALWRFNARHADPTVARYCRVDDSLQEWPSLAQRLPANVERIRQLEERRAQESELDGNALSELRGLYRQTFAAFEARGIAEAAAEAAQTAAVKTLSSSASPARLPAMCPEPVFIIGSPRSGTSILGWALAQHSEFWTEAESDIFFYMLVDGRLERAFETSMLRPDGSWLGNHGVDLEQFLAYVGLGLNALFTWTSRGRRWVDQTPANTSVVDRLAAMFPGARFIHMLRDGRRVVHSMINFHHAIGDEKAVEQWEMAARMPTWASDFDNACETWARFTGIAADFAHEHPDRTFTVTNERLTAEPEAAMHDVLAFLGVRQQPGPAELLRTQRINSSFAASGRSTQSPTLAEPWLDWLPEQRSTFMTHASERMVSCGLVDEAELHAWANGTGESHADHGNVSAPSEPPLKPPESSADTSRAGG